ncbi:MAG TPA: glycosyltransferase family 2 protein [Gaiellaceae bacterium]|nr:glycosyltransferase family 2 protein [Gaiellaceae bacterium]
MRATVVVPTWNGVLRIARLLESLDRDVETIVVDNGSRDGTADLVRERFPHVQLLELPENVGYARAVNAGAREAQGNALVFVNNDCVLDEGFATELVAPLDPAAGVVMVAGVLREARDPTRIDTAGMELDETLLALDYLNGEPVTVLDGGVPDPIGPCAAAAAFDREAFLGAGGFDEAFFAYWEDVDLVLRLRLLGGRCVLAPRAQGVHEHSATLKSGSARKNMLTGWGRGYVLRRWSVLGGSRIPKVLLRDGAICLGQAGLDRNVAGLRGRLAGYRAAATVERRPYPGSALAPRDERGAGGTLATRGRRRRRLRRTPS